MKEIEINGLTKKQTLENMNYNAADHVSKAEEFKKPVDLAEWMKNFSNNHGVTAP